VADTTCSRRDMLRTAVMGAGVGLAGATLVDFASPPVLDAQTSLSPADALQELIAGNQRCVANQLTSIQQDLDVLRNHTADKQEPFAAVLACADSRMPVELIFDQTIGRLFVARVAGNLVTPEIIASLEYAVAVLGVKAILVLGHSNCGAVKAAIKAEPVPGQISALYPPLRRAVEHSHGEVGRAIAINADVQAELLRTSSTVIRDGVKAGKVSVASGVYDLSTGHVSLA